MVVSLPKGEQLSLDWLPWMTRRGRGLLIATVLVVFLGGGLLVQAWAQHRADSAAFDAEVSLRNAVAELPAPTPLNIGFGGSYDMDLQQRLRGGTLAEIRQQPSGMLISVEVRAGLGQNRCVVASVKQGQQLVTTVIHGSCYR